MTFKAQAQRMIGSIKCLDEGNEGKEQRESGGESFFKVDCVIQSAAINHQLFNASVAEG